MRLIRHLSLHFKRSTAPSSVSAAAPASPSAQWLAKETSASHHFPITVLLLVNHGEHEQERGNPGESATGEAAWETDPILLICSVLLGSCPGLQVSYIRKAPRRKANSFLSLGAPGQEGKGLMLRRTVLSRPGSITGWRQRSLNENGPGVCPGTGWRVHSEAPLQNRVCGQPHGSLLLRARQLCNLQAELMNVSLNGTTTNETNPSHTQSPLQKPAPWASGWGGPSNLWSLVFSVDA